MGYRRGLRSIGTAEIHGRSASQLWRTLCQARTLLHPLRPTEKTRQVAAVLPDKAPEVFKSDFVGRKDPSRFPCASANRGYARGKIDIPGRRATGSATSVELAQGFLRRVGGCVVAGARADQRMSGAVYGHFDLAEAAIHLLDRR